MAVLGVDDFKAKLKGGGARANLFKVTINYPAYAAGNVEITSFLCRAASLPASQVPEIEVPFRGRILHIAGDRTFDTWSTTIINDTDFAIRNALERWMNGINAHSANTGLVNPTDYQADMLVDQLDKDGSIIKQYKFLGCFPTNVAQIELSYDQATTIEEFEVTWRYQYWQSDTTN